MATVRTAKREPKTVKEAWAEVASVEKDVLGSATRVAERMPAPVDVIDSSLLFATKMLRAQRDALVPLLQGVGPKTGKGKPALTPAAEAVHAAFDLAESIVETQRKVLRGLVETVTPPLARHAHRPAKATTRPRRVPSGRAPARRARKAAA